MRRGAVCLWGLRWGGPVFFTGSKGVPEFFHEVKDEPHTENNQIYLHPLQLYSPANDFFHAEQISNGKSSPLKVLALKFRPSIDSSAPLVHINNDCSLIVQQINLWCKLMMIFFLLHALFLKSSSAPCHFWVHCCRIIICLLPAPLPILWLAPWSFVSNMACSLLRD